MSHLGHRRGQNGDNVLKNEYTKQAVCYLFIKNNNK